MFGNAIDITYIGPNPAINAYAKSHGEAVRIISGSTSGGAFLVVRDGIDARPTSGHQVATPARNTRTSRCAPCSRPVVTTTPPARRRVGRAAGERQTLETFPPARSIAPSRSGLPPITEAAPRSSTSVTQARRQVRHHLMVATTFLRPTRRSSRILPAPSVPWR
jgi:hypothetical protein